jgi:hypothetical protein
MNAFDWLSDAVAKSRVVSGEPSSARRLQLTQLKGCLCCLMRVCLNSKPCTGVRKKLAGLL